MRSESSAAAGEQRPKDESENEVSVWLTFESFFTTTRTSQRVSKCKAKAFKASFSKVRQCA